MKLQATMAVIASTVLMGCQSTSKPIKPRPFTNEHSYAYNIANQTSLTRNNSPLRDFTLEEIKETRTKMVQASGAEASVVLGGISVLTGSLIGIINVAGGAAGALAHSDHEASKPRFIVVVNAKDYQSKEEVAKYIVKTARKTALETLSIYGNVEFTRKGGVELLTINGEAAGLVNFADINVSAIKLGEMNIDGKRINAYTYGVYDDTSKNDNMLITPPSPLVVGAKDNSIDYREFYKKYTSTLPEGFYIYTPSFPQARGNKMVYSNPSVIVPAIYTQGEKYEFIKPQ